MDDAHTNEVAADMQVILFDHYLLLAKRIFMSPDKVEPDPGWRGALDVADFYLRDMEIKSLGEDRVNETEQMIDEVMREEASRREIA